MVWICETTLLDDIEAFMTTFERLMKAHEFEQTKCQNGHGAAGTTVDWEGAAGVCSS